MSSNPNQFASELQKATKTQKPSVKAPKLAIKHVEDLYVLYVIEGGIDHETFWHSPIATVERIYSNKLAFDGWKTAKRESDGMAGRNNNEVQITFKAFNSDFNKSIKEMNAEAANLKQQMKLQQEQMKHSSTETERLEAKVGSLQQIYQVAQRRTQEAANALERAKQIWGEQSEEVRRLETQLRRQQIAEQQAANAITETQQALQRAQQAQANQQQSLRELNNILQVSGRSLGIFLIY